MHGETILNIFGIKFSDLLWTKCYNLYDAKAKTPFGSVAYNNGKIIARFGNDIDPSIGAKFYVESDQY